MGRDMRAGGGKGEAGGDKAGTAAE